ncbi:TrbC/VirB2 family protein [Gordonia sihwensis]|uniref:TrbC/VirB2 family protein n=1 Tax=Gordonia sihwensis TaxID=173559 RepID=UPI0005EECC47|nr:TrbC/VirB2 family protein [Gordonia sihwensis]KJR10427.1 hypothetical protein UG54_00010 [Gordonia sihwensis]
MTVINTAETITNNAAGVDSLVNMINNTTNLLKTVGVAIIVLVIVGVGISIMFGAFGSGQNLRSNLSKIGIIILGGVLVGGAAFLGGVFIGTGEQVTNTPSSNTGGVN